MRLVQPACGGGAGAGCCRPAHRGAATAVQGPQHTGHQQGNAGQALGRGQLLAQRDERSLIGLSLGELEEMAQLRGFDDGRFAGQRGVPTRAYRRRR